MTAAIGMKLTRVGAEESYIFIVGAVGGGWIRAGTEASNGGGAGDREDRIAATACAVTTLPLREGNI